LKYFAINEYDNQPIGNKLCDLQNLISQFVTKNRNFSANFV